MNPENSSQDDSDSNDFLEAAVDYILDTMTSEELQNLLTDPKVWEALVTEAELPRDDADKLYEVLSDLMIDTVTEEKYEQEFREHFLKEFPLLRQQLEERIAQFHALADMVDKVHRHCTISNVVASSTGIVSGILTIAGLSLAPVTAGVSLALTATGVGLGTAATVTSVSTSIVEHVNMSYVEAKANMLSSTGINVDDMVKGIIHDNKSKVISVGNCLLNGLNGIKRSTRAIKLIESKPHLATRASRLMSGGKMSAPNARQVKKAFAGTPLAMTKGARIFGTVSACITIVTDVVNLVQNSKELHEGAKTESAENLRQQAQELEQKLEELIQIYESLL